MAWSFHDFMFLVDHKKINFNVPLVKPSILSIKRLTSLSLLGQQGSLNKTFFLWSNNHSGIISCSSSFQHSPDFRKPRCGKARTIRFDPNCPLKQFSTVFFREWNGWIQLLFYFFLVHRLKALNKEQYNLTHVVVVVILQIFIKNTHCLAYVAFANISSRLWLGDNTIWHILSIKEICQVFI